MAATAAAAIESPGKTDVLHTPLKDSVEPLRSLDKRSPVLNPLFKIKLPVVLKAGKKVLPLALKKNPFPISISLLTNPTFGALSKKFAISSKLALGK